MLHKKFNQGNLNIVIYLVFKFPWFNQEDFSNSFFFKLIHVKEKVPLLFKLFRNF